MNKLTKIATFLAIFWPLSGKLEAHHAFPETYNTSRIVEIEGEVIALRWINPHIEFSLLANDGSVWEIESNGIGQMQRLGIGRSQLAIGEHFIIAGFPARDGSNKMHASNLLEDSGKETVLRPGSEPRWNTIR